MSRPDEPARTMRFAEPAHQVFQRSDGTSSDCHGCLDSGVRVVAFTREVAELVVEESLRLPLDHQRWQWTRLPRELLLHLFDVVVVDVHVTTIPGERAHLKAGLLGYHVRQQCVAGDVERHAEEHVATALCHDDRQHPLCNMKLEHVVTRLQRHLAQLIGTPGRHDNPTRVGVVDDGLQRLRDLVYLPAVLRLPVSPLNSVDGAEVAVLQRELLVSHDSLFVAPHTALPLNRIGRRNCTARSVEVPHVRPLAPDVVVFQQERTNVAVTAQEPEQFTGNKPEWHLLSGDQRKPFPQIVSNRGAGQAPRSGTGTVALVDAVFVNVAKNLFVCDKLWHYYSQGTRTHPVGASLRYQLYTMFDI